MKKEPREHVQGRDGNVNEASAEGALQENDRERMPDDIQSVAEAMAWAEVSSPEEPREEILHPPTAGLSKIADERVRELLEIPMGILRDWLSVPYVSDRFGRDHKSRSQWERDVHERFGEAGSQKLKEIEENKLRANVIGRAETAIKTLERFAERQAEAVPGLAEKIDGVIASQEFTFKKGGELAALSLKERRAYIEKLEDVVVAVFKALGEYFSSSAAQKEKGGEEAQGEQQAA